MTEKNQMESITMYRKFKIEYSWGRNMFSRSNMDFFVDEVISEGINEYI